MNEATVTRLIREIRSSLDELESEVRNHPESYMPRPEMYDEIKRYDQWDDDDGWTD